MDTTISFRLPAIRLRVPGKDVSDGAGHDQLRPGDLCLTLNAGDLDRMSDLLAPDLVAWVTNADGEADRITGRDEYLSRIAAMDLPAARYRVTLTQSPAAIDEHLVLLMVEVRAERDGRRLHNFAAHVLRVDEGRVTEWRMADAKPAESDQFWS